MQSSKPIDRKDGFGGGADAVIKSLENRSKNSWEGAATGACPRAHVLALAAIGSARSCGETRAVFTHLDCAGFYIRIACSV